MLHDFILGPELSVTDQALIARKKMSFILDSKLTTPKRVLEAQK